MAKAKIYNDPDEWPEARASHWELRHGIAERGVTLDAYDTWDVYALAWMHGRCSSLALVLELRREIEGLKAQLQAPWWRRLWK